MSDFFRTYVGGVLFGAGLVVTLGVYFHVFAVSPGAVVDPTFNPKSDDVYLNLQLDCVKVQNSGWAKCPGGYSVTGGGLTCGNDGLGNSILFQVECSTDASNKCLTAADVTACAGICQAVNAYCSKSNQSIAICCRL